jgi:hypothetical protein
MTERKRVLYSLFLLALFAAQIMYVCTSFAFDQDDTCSTSISLEEEVEEDVPSSTSEEDNETENSYLPSENFISVILKKKENNKPIVGDNRVSLFVHLDTPYSPPELMI